MDKTILVIEDVQEDRELVAAILESRGYKVEAAEDGQSGLEKVRKAHPVLVVLDILMPRINGFEFFKEMRTDKELSKIPVFVLTSRAKMADSFLSLGVNGFMAKPLAIDRFLQEVDKLANPSGEKMSARPESKVEISAPAQKKVPVENSFPKDSQSTSSLRKKVIIFGHEETILQSMRQELEKLGHFIVIIKEENQILPTVQDAKPDVVLLAINAETKAPIDKLVYTIDVLFPKQKQGEVKKNADGSLPLLRKMNIVLYKVEKETVGATSSEGSFADMESLLERCKENGASKYIGAYTSFSFISKIQEFLK
jgi:CheY-like chemotaxis protein